MRRSVPLLLAAFTALVALGCERSSDSSLAVSALTAPKAATSTVDTHSRANIVWDDQVMVNGHLDSAGIRGDGRNRKGQALAPLNEYQSDFCGVRGLIYDQKNESGNLTLDPDTYYTATMSTLCGAARSMAFYLSGNAGSVTTAAPDIIGPSLWSMAPDAVRLQAMLFGMQQVTCFLKFDAAYAGASNALVTRLADGVDASGAVVRRWRLESQGNHKAACLTLTTNSDRWTDTGRRYYLPFAATVTQVRYPNATFPSP